MCRRKDDVGECARGTAGFAYVGGACHVDESRQKLNKAGIVEDSGGFSGQLTNTCRNNKLRKPVALQV